MENLIYSKIIPNLNAMTVLKHDDIIKKSGDHD